MRAFLKRPALLHFCSLASCIVLAAYYGMAQADERLSQVLESQANSAVSASEQLYLPGVMWKIPDEYGAQDNLRTELLDALDHLEITGPTPNRLKKQRSKFKVRLDALPITTRVVLPRMEPLWLEANPRFDPIFKPSQSLEFRANPGTVAVLLPDGSQCSVPHRSGVSVAYYLSRCTPSHRADWAWLIQAGGLVSKVSVERWNVTQQIEAAPGAWIWAPNRDEDWSDRFSDNLASFLATQGPSGSTLNAILPNRVLDFGWQEAAEAYRAEDDRDLPLSANDLGLVGLLQTPTARFYKEGNLTVNLSHAYPYYRMQMMVTPFDWLETGLRYTAITNQLYGPVSFSGTQSYKDKSVDLKVRLWTESAHRPQVAVGIQDVGGTGLFSSEYVVANKRWDDFDVSAGLAWGYMGNGGDIRNPISYLVSSYQTRRANDVGQGGQVSYKTFFSGPTALFGGVQYHTPWEHWVVKAELDGNNYQSEPLGNVLKHSSPINLGLTHVDKNVDLSFGLERGNTFMFNVALHGNIAEVSMPKISMPPMPPLDPMPVLATEPSMVSPPRDIPSNVGTASLSPEKRAEIIDEIFKQIEWKVKSIRAYDDDTWVCDIQFVKGRYFKELLPRMIRVLHHHAPANISTFRLMFTLKGMYISEYTVDRAQFVRNESEWLPPSERAPAIELDRSGHPWRDDAVRSRVAYGVEEEEAAYGPYEVAYKEPKGYEASLGTFYRQVLGGPNGFWFYTLGLEGAASLDLWKGAWLMGAVDYKVLTNLDSYTQAGSSNLPRVRTFLQQYATATDVMIPNAQFVQAVRLSNNQYVSAYAGLLESYFGGVGAEWLYRKTGSSWALGVDVNRVRQRDFQQKFAFLDYEVTTGHASLYWDTGWQGLNVKTSVGQYLAGDRGVTVDIGKTFQNGARVGAFATRTNVSATQFGEGSFDKGIYLSIPFDAFLTHHSNSSANFVWRPTTRDGGAILDRNFTLYNATDLRNPKRLEYGPPLLTP
jgi:hypothetical protein